jgi:uncharacterized protein (DUF305 family)
MSITKLSIMTALHFLAMYLLMYSMVDRVNYVYPNLNQFYMAGLMTAPMLMMEAIFMSSMFENKRILMGILGTGFTALVLLFIFIRTQAAITDKEFLRSMIPHHSGAILMCREASLTDPEIQQLCIEIMQGQQEEIDIMERKLSEL